MAALVDTNILVYRFDPRFPEKQATALQLLRDGISRGDLRLPHQAVVEFVAVVTRRLRGEAPLLEPAEAMREAELLMSQFEILYPSAGLLRTALRGAAMYQLSWFDAHLWAYAEHFGIGQLLSEDFQDGQLLGTVRVLNPFSAARPDR